MVDVPEVRNRLRMYARLRCLQVNSKVQIQNSREKVVTPIITTVITFIEIR